jgi:hypothetical protein
MCGVISERDRSVPSSVIVRAVVTSDLKSFRRVRLFDAVNTNPTPLVRASSKNKKNIMKNILKHNRIAAGLVVVLLLTLSVVVYTQVNRPYRNGSVWNIAFIKMKPGMDTAYLTYLADGWKRGQEAAKKEGLILSYKVLTTEAHGPTDWNVMLMTEYKDLATMEANEAKADNLSQVVVGNDEKQMQGYRDRLQIREVMGDRLAREIILEPRR